MHLGPLHLEVGIPPGGPLDIALHEVHLVGVDNGLVLLDAHGHSSRVALDLVGVLVVHLARLDVLRVVLDAAGHDLEPDHHPARGGRGVLGPGRDGVGGVSGSHDARDIGVLVLVDEDGELEVVEDVVVDADADPDGVPRPAHEVVVLPGVADGGEVVEDEVDLVHLVDALLEEREGVGAQRRGAAEEDVGLVGVHAEAVGRVLDAVAHEELAEVLGAVLDPVLGLAEGEAVVAEGHLGVDGSERVHLHVEVVPGVVFVRVAPREVEPLGARHRGREQRGRRDGDEEEHAGAGHGSGSTGGARIWAPLQ